MHISLQIQIRCLFHRRSNFMDRGLIISLKAYMGDTLSFCMFFLYICSFLFLSSTTWRGNILHKSFFCCNNLNIYKYNFSCYVIKVTFVFIMSGSDVCHSLLFQYPLIRRTVLEVFCPCWKWVGCSDAHFPMEFALPLSYHPSCVSVCLLTNTRAWVSVCVCGCVGVCVCVCVCV